MLNRVSGIVGHKIAATAMPPLARWSASAHVYPLLPGPSATALIDVCHAEHASAETHALQATVFQHFKAKASADPENGERDPRANHHWLHVRHGLPRRDAKLHKSQNKQRLNAPLANRVNINTGDMSILIKIHI